MLYLRTNVPQFRNDLGEIIRIFYDVTEVELTQETPLLHDDDALLQCDINSGVARSDFFICNKVYTYIDRPIEESHSQLQQKKLEKRSIKRASFCAIKQSFSNFETPWGCLTGIRPTKLARELTSTIGEAKARLMLADTFFVEQDKIDLLMDICTLQQPIISSTNQTNFDLYIGIPFCKTRCLYCSFAAYELGKGCATPEGIEAYIEALLREIKQNIPPIIRKGYHIRSVYIGGGTPTALSCGQLSTVLEAALETCGGFGLEFTVEAGRPDTITEEKLHMLKRMGVSRISINPQSMNDKTLQLIGRSHSSAQIKSAIKLAQDIGFDSINMDTIIGLPGEDERMVAYTMEQIERLDPHNLTVHTLAIKRSSKLKAHLGEIELPDAETAQKMLDVSQQAAKRLHMEAYYMYRQKYMRGNLENVGYCKKGKESIYNIDIMEETTNILALGAGAITKWVYDAQSRIERQPNPKDVASYIAKINEMTTRRLSMI